MIDSFDRVDDLDRKILATAVRQVLNRRGRHYLKRFFDPVVQDTLERFAQLADFTGINPETGQPDPTWHWDGVVVHEELECTDYNSLAAAIADGMTGAVLPTAVIKRWITYHENWELR